MRSDAGQPQGMAPTMVRRVSGSASSIVGPSLVVALRHSPIENGVRPYNGTKTRRNDETSIVGAYPCGRPVPSQRVSLLLKFSYKGIIV